MNVLKSESFRKIRPNNFEQIMILVKLQISCMCIYACCYEVLLGKGTKPTCIGKSLIVNLSYCVSCPYRQAGAFE